MENAINAPRYCLTLDTDWVPPFVLDDVLALLGQTPVKATIFRTSPYPMPVLANVDWGIHPNILAGSSHGDTPKACIEAVCAMTPPNTSKIRASRTHSFAWCTGCPGWLRAHGITHDASVYRPGERDLVPFMDNGLIRVPSWWGDRAYLSSGGNAARFAPPGLETPGLKVLLFHPIHIYLNNPNLDAWRVAFPSRPLFSLTAEELAPFRCSGDGARTVFLSALEFLSKRETGFITDLDVPHA